MGNKTHLSLTVDRETWEKISRLASAYGQTKSETLLKMYWLFSEATELKTPIFTRPKNLTTRNIVCTTLDREHMGAKKCFFRMTWDELIESAYNYSKPKMGILSESCNGSPGGK